MTTLPPNPESGRGPAGDVPRGARAMNLLRWGLLAVLAVAAVAALWPWVAPRLAGRPPAVAQGTIYLCPMHPQITSDRPGECPICGMDLVLRTVETAPPAAADGMPGLAPVTLTPERLQMIGVRLAVAGRRALGGERELYGFVTPDEARLARVQLRVSGWVERLDVDEVGRRVDAGQPLLSLYSPELHQAEREFLIALESGGGDGATVAASRARLRLLGVPAAELSRLESTREASTRLELTAPFAGTVLERGVVKGQYVGPDTPLLTLADLSRVWVVADLYEQDVANVAAGDPARFETAARPGRVWDGRVDFVYPTVSTATRTVRARLVLENRDGALKPGMYGRVHVGGNGAGALALPEEAVLNTGDARYVYRYHAGGRFEPQPVRVGREQDGWAEILGGLVAGDTVVASAAFLIDSESRLEASLREPAASPTAASPATPAGGASHQHAPGSRP